MIRLLKRCVCWKTRFDDFVKSEMRNVNGSINRIIRVHAFVSDLKRRNGSNNNF
jgi:hypothetical protein